MSPMDPIEIADGHNRATSPGGKITDVLDRDHQRAAPFSTREAARSDRNTLERAAIARRSLSPPVGRQVNARRGSGQRQAMHRHFPRGLGTDTWSDRPTMNVLILGDGDEELAWARWILGRPEHRLEAAYPGFADSSMAGIPDPSRPGGRPGPPRAGCRRSSAARSNPAANPSAVPPPRASPSSACTRPGPDSEAYYQVALSREETGAVIVPDLPLRLHPGVRAIRQAPPGRRARLLPRAAAWRRPRRLGMPAWSVFAFASGDRRGPPDRRRGRRPHGHRRPSWRRPGSRAGRAPAIVRALAVPRSASARELSGPARLTLLGSLGSLTLEIDPTAASRSPPPPPAGAGGTGRADRAPALGPARGHLRGTGRLDRPPRGRRTARPEPAGRHPSHGADRGGRPESPPGPDGRAPLRIDQRGRHLQVGHDVDRLHGLHRRAALLPLSDGRPAAGHAVDALYPLPHPAGTRPLRPDADPPPGDPSAG